MSRSAQTVLARAALVGVAYFALSMIVFETIDPDAAGAPWWPGAGVTVAALCLTPRSRWPPILAAIFLADFCADLLQDTPVGVSIGWAISNTIEPVLVALAIYRVKGRAVPLLDGVPQVLLFTAVVAFSGPPVASLIGTITSVIGLGQPFLPTWPRWLIGDALGILLVAPVLIHWRQVLGVARHLHGVALIAAAAAVPALILLPTGNPLHHLPYGITPILLIAAMVDGIPGAAITSLVMATTLNLLSSAGYGPFDVPPDNPNSGLLQLFVIVEWLTAMLLAAQATALRRADVQMAHQEDAMHRDALTGVGNRLALERALVTLEAERRATAGAAVLFLDLDNFKQVNDELGHEAGDELLRAVAARCDHLVRPEDTVARSGGDEFAIVCPDIDREAAHELRDRLQRELVETVSVGMAWAPPGAFERAALLREADAEMYRAKAARREHAGEPVATRTDPRFAAREASERPV